jgi:hypothetical protein
MSELSKIKRLEVIQGCYTSVATLFALFHKSNAKGPNFKWEHFPKMCEDFVEDWVFIANLTTKRNKAMVKEFAASCSKEFATKLCQRAGYISSRNGEIIEK